MIRMALQVLPPEMLETPKDKIETKEKDLYWKPSSLKDGESEEFGFRLVTFVSTATLLLVLILEHRTIWHERPIGPSPTVQRSKEAL